MKNDDSDREYRANVACAEGVLTQAVADREFVLAVAEAMEAYESLGPPLEGDQAFIYDILVVASAALGLELARQADFLDQFRPEAD